MSAVLLTLLLLLPGDKPAALDTTRKPNPFAPSLPLLTDAEEEQLDRAIDGFIRYDLGRMRADEGRQALSEFLRLGPEAIPALIRGLNRAAAIDGSCPAVTIAKKLSVMLRATKDVQLLEYARENIGAGVTHSRHMGVLRDLRITCMLRKRSLLTQQTTSLQTAAPPKDRHALSTSELVMEAAETPPGPQRGQILRELDSRRPDRTATDLGALAADDSNPKVQQTAREFLRAALARLDGPTLKARLRDELSEVRAAAARVAGDRGYHFEAELIDLLNDDNGAVRQAARQALARLHRGIDFGPGPDADDAGRAAAVRQWQAWWARHNGR
jgi:hypothetical protein